MLITVIIPVIGYSYRDLAVDGITQHARTSQSKLLSLTACQPDTNPPPCLSLYLLVTCTFSPPSLPPCIVSVIEAHGALWICTQEMAAGAGGY